MTTSPRPSADRPPAEFGHPPPPPELETPAQRRLRYLWRPPEPSTVGRKASRSLAEVVAAAIQIADEAGLAAVSIRKVAGRLGVAPMSLYTYLPGKEELVDHMIETAHSELRLPGDSAGWDEALREIAHELRSMYLRHPWLLDTNPARLPLAPHVLDAEEAVLRALQALELPARQVVEIAALVRAFVRDQSRAEIAEASEARASGQNSESYWDSVESFWQTYFDPERYPAMVAIWNAGGFDAGEASFDEALSRLIATLHR